MPQPAAKATQPSQPPAQALHKPHGQQAPAAVAAAALPITQPPLRLPSSFRHALAQYEQTADAMPRETSSGSSSNSLEQQIDNAGGAFQARLEQHFGRPADISRTSNSSSHGSTMSRGADGKPVQGAMQPGAAQPGAAAGEAASGMPVLQYIQQAHFVALAGAALQVSA